MQFCLANFSKSESFYVFIMGFPTCIWSQVYGFKVSWFLSYRPQIMILSIVGVGNTELKEKRKLFRVQHNNGHCTLATIWILSSDNSQDFHSQNMNLCCLA